MTPIPGIVASQITGHLSTSSYESIATVTVGSGGSSSISFTSIPSTYTHLQIRGIGRTVAAGSGNSNVYFYANSDTTAGNYYSHYLYGTGAAAGASSAASSVIGFETPNDGNTASVYGGLVMDVLDYASTSKNKTVRSLSGFDANGSGLMAMTSVLWKNSSTAISSITLTAQDGNWKQYSSFALYGIRG